MSDDGSGGAPHRDEISEVEAEADAQLPGRDHGLARPADLDRSSETVPRDDTSGDVIGVGPAPNHRRGRQRFLIVYLRVTLIGAFLIGVAELLLPTETQDEAGVVMVAVLIAAPLGRIVWLLVRWLRIGDWRFALVGAVLLGVVATGLIVR